MAKNRFYKKKDDDGPGPGGFGFFTTAINFFFIYRD